MQIVIVLSWQETDVTAMITCQGTGPRGKCGFELRVTVSGKGTWDGIFFYFDFFNKYLRNESGKSFFEI
jgi:hypothetical protein